MTVIRWIPNWFRPGDAERVLVGPDGSGRIALRDALPGCSRGTDLAVWRNGAPVEPEGEQGYIFAGVRDDVVAVARPRGTGVEVILINLAISFLAGLVLNRILRPPKAPEDTTDDGPTYGFAGLESQRKEGRPQQTIYGRHRAAGTIINEGIASRREQSQPPVYFAQLAFGSGPVQSIGSVTAETVAGSELMTSIRTRATPAGIQLDGTDIDAIPGAVASIRLGAISQAPASGFDLIEQVVDVGKKLTSPEGSVQSGGTYDEINPPLPILDPLTDSQSESDTYWGNRGVAADTLTDADWGRVTLNYSRGYFTVNDGIPAGRNWSHVVRYIELDSSGTPITTGGDHGDGWVRLPYYYARHRGENPFAIDHQFPFLDPRTYATPTSMGASLRSDGTNSGGTTDCSVASPTVPWSEATPVSAFSIAAWVRVDEIAEDGGAIPWTVAYQKSRTAGGFALKFKAKSYTAGPDTTVTKWVPVFEMVGSSLSGGEFFESWDDLSREPRFALDSPQDTTFQEALAWRVHHVAVTYQGRGGIDGENDRIRLYVDGELMEEYLGNVQLLGSTASLHIGKDPTTNRPISGCIDELWITQTELSDEDVARAYNNGSGLRGAIGSVADSKLYHVFAAADLVAGYHFDGDANSFDMEYGNNATITGNFTTTFSTVTPGGADAVPLIPLYPTAATIHRGRYRVEVARNIETTVHVSSFDTGVQFDRLTWALEQQQQNPSVAVLSLRVAAGEALSGQVPAITADVEGRVCYVWDGNSASDPLFVEQWTRNPAWVVTDIALRERIGLGEQFTAANIDVVSFQAWADYCDEVVYDLRGNRVYGDEASTTTTPAVTRMRYDSSVSGEPTFDGRGRIQLFLDNPPPPNWAVGRHVAWTGEATAGGSVDHNISAAATGGYEIASMTPSGSGTAWIVAVYWDRLADGHPWTSGSFLDLEGSLSGLPYKGVYGGRIRRHTWDAVHDTAEEAWDKIQEIASVGRAIIYFDGTKLRAKINRARDPVGVVSFASIIEGSFEVEYSNPRERPNAYTIEFLDEDRGWARASTFVDHETAATAQGSVELDQDSLFIRGITRRPAARRHGKFLLNVNQEIIRSGSFSAAIDAIHYEPGDVLVVQHDVLPWGTGGRTSADSTTTTELVLDRTVTVGASGTYYVDVSDPNANGFHTALIADAAGDYTTVTLDSGLPFIPSADLRYVFYEEDERRLVEVSSIRVAPDMSAQVEWVEYVASIYDDTPTDETTSEVLAPVDTWGTQDEDDVWASEDLSDTWGLQA